MVLFLPTIGSRASTPSTKKTSVTINQAEITKAVIVNIDVLGIPLSGPLGSLLAIKNLRTGEVFPLEGVVSLPVRNAVTSATFRVGDQFQVIIYNELLSLELPVLGITNYTVKQGDDTPNSTVNFIFKLLITRPPGGRN
ncbi:hypothetical protein [Sphingobacterium kitahiroshimense]|uniref:Uncharacterized protein n=1 Tax=Sphingobacterium kitahiroshimense TaxID=470446 RepID=A0ABV0BPS1_9SPHI